MDFLFNPKCSKYPGRRCLGTKKKMQNHLQKGLEHKGHRFFWEEQSGGKGYTLVVKIFFAGSWKVKNIYGIVFLEEM